MAQRKLIVHEDPKSPISEAYRTLRTNLQFAKINSELRTIMFTSSGPAEGKSTTIANVAVALAQSGRSIILVDCDLRKPVQHRIFGKRNKGVTNILVDDSPAETFLQDTEIDNLRILPSGPIPPNPSELLSSAKMIQLLDELKGLADFVLIDAPPTIAVTDAAVMAVKVDGIVLVIDSTSVRPEMAQKAKDLLVKANGHILGVILNRVEIEEEHAYYYYYYGSESKSKK
ncbi:CpsD/CapB family tyrosine-protein kinase [Anaerospora sp.]|uniref:CpsD/CapB family tyrosine-protein kinase n=1 Tax=Anaerospora sp. TaxID=1960278 RepID=UPI0028A17CE3|nr:CpsD/CapB family tyrosine-protein kinase [Anaerospora sp.]